MRPSALAAILTMYVSATIAGELSVDDAARQACDSLLDAGDIVSALQHGKESTEALILENTRDWVPWFNHFASTDAALILHAFAEGAYAASDDYNPRVCAVLRPVSAVTTFASTIAGAGGDIEWGHFLMQGDDASAAIDVIPERCAFFVYELPLPDPCSTP